MEFAPADPSLEGGWALVPLCVCVCVCAFDFLNEHWDTARFYWPESSGGDPSCSATFSAVVERDPLFSPKKEGFLALQVLINLIYFDLISSGPKRTYPDKRRPSGSMRGCHSLAFTYPEAAAFFMGFSHLTSDIIQAAFKSDGYSSVLSPGRGRWRNCPGGFN